MDNTMIALSFAGMSGVLIGMMIGALAAAHKMGFVDLDFKGLFTNLGMKWND